MWGWYWLCDILNLDASCTWWQFAPDNTRVQTHTEYKTLDPVWQKVGISYPASRHFAFLVQKWVQLTTSWQWERIVTQYQCFRSSFSQCQMCIPAYLYLFLMKIRITKQNFWVCFPNFNLILAMQYAIFAMHCTSHINLWNFENF